MDAAKLQKIVDEVHVATSVATEIIAASGIGGNFNEALVERGEDAAFGIVKAALTGYTSATGKVLTVDEVTALLITDAPLVADEPPAPPVIEPPVIPVAEPPVVGQVDGVNTTAGVQEGAASGTTEEGAAKEGSEPPQ